MYSISYLNSDRPCRGFIEFFKQPSVPPLLHFTLLIDVSGSMEPHINMVHLAIKVFLSMIPDSSTLRVITFNQLAKCVIQRKSSKEVDISMFHLTATGATNMHAALNLAQEDVDGRLVLVILSDGLTNVGITNTVDILSSIYYKDNTTCACIGFNEVSELQMDLLAGLSMRLDGNLHTPKNYEGLMESFGDVIADVQNISYTLFMCKPYHIRESRKIMFEIDNDEIITVLKDNVPIQIQLKVPFVQDTDYNVDEFLILQDVKTCSTYQIIQRIDMHLLHHNSPILQQLRQTLFTNVDHFQLSFEVSNQRSGVDSVMNFPISDSQQTSRSQSKYRANNPQSLVNSLNSMSIE